MQTEPDNQSFYSFDKLELSALEAINEAQRLAFAPVVFHALVLLRDRGILEFLKINHHTGATIEEVSKNCNISEYGARVLLESGLGSRVCILKDGKYYLTKVGYYINSDEMTRVNMNYSLDVCYKAMIHLGKAIDHEYAAGLVELGPWRTIYEGLSILPEPAKKVGLNSITFILTTPSSRCFLFYSNICPSKFLILEATLVNSVLLAAILIQMSK